MAAVAIAVAAGAAGYAWARPTVRWSQVAAAVGRQDTLHGLARVYLPDGSEWEYALWARIKGPGKTITNGMARPVRLAPGQSRPPLRPHPMLTTFGEAMDVCGEKGVITRLIAAGQARARARRAECGGRKTLWVEMDTPPRLRGASGDAPDAWSFHLDPESKLVLAVSIFTRERGGRTLRVRCEYDYNAPLPPGFREK